jgi:hypothetical protein
MSGGSHSVTLELIVDVLAMRAKRHGVELLFIQPASSQYNCFFSKY